MSVMIFFMCEKNKKNIIGGNLRNEYKIYGSGNF
jgi:hypothetical protein